MQVKLVVGYSSRFYLFKMRLNAHQCKIIRNVVQCSDLRMKANCMYRVLSHKNELKSLIRGYAALKLNGDFSSY